MLMYYENERLEIPFLFILLLFHLSSFIFILFDLFSDYFFYHINHHYYNFWL